MTENNINNNLLSSPHPLRPFDLFTPSPSRPASAAATRLPNTRAHPSSTTARTIANSTTTSTKTNGGGSSSQTMPTLDANSSRLIVVSNRLPITISSHPSSAPPTKDIPQQSSTEAGKHHHKAGEGEEKNSYSFKLSSGGLVSALSGCKKQMTFSWIGWTGLDVPEPDKPGIEDQLCQLYSCKAVWLSDELADKHYNGFSNSILWPLFHYHPGEMNFVESHWEAYKEANMKFARVVHKDILEAIERGEDVLVWVQDYHLMLLPMMLRELLASSEDNGLTNKNGSTTDKKKGKVSIGFFLHTPFPSSEIYRILPVRREILLGILHCDLVGFHTYDYGRHFLSSCTRILGLPAMPNGLAFGGRYVHVGSFPIGIEPTKFQEALLSPAVQKRILTLEQRFHGIKVIVGVDRLDYIKGVPQKLHALDVFLSEHPEWIGKVVLVQVAVPSRQDVEEYQNLRSNVNELVGRINGRFGTVEYMPIHFLHQSVSFDELCALYAISDACLVTSPRDGMNLVSYEYVACQEKRHGCMILSEFTGAAHSLNGSIIVNPWATDQVADGIFRAMIMDDEQRKENFKKLFSYVSKFTAAHWGLTFVAEMQRILKENELIEREQQQQEEEEKQQQQQLQQKNLDFDHRGFEGLRIRETVEEES
ncbi:Trehalose-6-P synthase/phosphatase complex synthase subunit [Puccinia graminis f. sp. tritici]|uniref:alpha,alpha-trehalose-phosphate synthase (UDP-forming) n=1 Tax=Puccinia graminis f. sp. tritici TaxID=56615 RepID=A0A5B0P5D0_PUCGR|nr:Trehalose-6-P synthase/phosphatase complex synthase subunit [Puccinia graminis f. sp. tritici]